jgi:hypothetical protein
MIEDGKNAFRVRWKQKAHGIASSHAPSSVPSEVTTTVLRRLGLLSLGLALSLGALLGTAREVRAQEGVPPATIDTIIIERDNVINEEEAASSGIFRFMNKIHITTREFVIRDYLQFDVGEPFDSASVAESERQLRLRRLFREITMDSVRLEDGSLAVKIRSQDGWSLKPKFNFSVASTGDWTGTFGVNEINLLGTGNQVYELSSKENPCRQDPENIRLV